MHQQCQWRTPAETWRLAHTQRGTLAETSHPARTQKAQSPHHFQLRRAETTHPTETLLLGPQDLTWLDLDFLTKLDLVSAQDQAQLLLHGTMLAVYAEHVTVMKSQAHCAVHAAAAVAAAAAAAAADSAFAPDASDAQVLMGCPVGAVRYWERILPCG